MSERNARLVRKYARMFPDGMDAAELSWVFKNGSPEHRGRIRAALIREIVSKDPEYMARARTRWQLRDFNATPSRSVRRRLGL